MDQRLNQLHIVCASHKCIPEKFTGSPERCRTEDLMQQNYGRYQTKHVFDQACSLSFMQMQDKLHKINARQKYPICRIYVTESRGRASVYVLPDHVWVTWQENADLYFIHSYIQTEAKCQHFVLKTSTWLKRTVSGFCLSKVEQGCVPIARKRSAMRRCEHRRMPRALELPVL